MNTRKPTFPCLPVARLILCLVISLSLGGAWPAFAQTATPAATTSPQANPQLKNWTATNSATLMEKMLSTAQVPDEVAKPNLMDLLREENRRLKQRLETLEKENTDLKARLGGK